MVTVVRGVTADATDNETAQHPSEATLRDHGAAGVVVIEY
jgi:hypothetical protein